VQDAWLPRLLEWLTGAHSRSDDEVRAGLRRFVPEYNSMTSAPRETSDA
jgi:hypothetical protein